MTDQQPHTPYIEDGWLVEPCEPDYAPGISQPIPGSWSKPIVNLAELDGYDELIAAAEQRGAARGKIEGLREAATSIRDSKFANSVKPPSKKVQVKEADWLDALADRLEADGD